MISGADQKYWDALYANSPLGVPSLVLFKDLFDRYLRPNGTLFEVGCYPGNFLVYLGKRFGYVISGIDTTPYVLSTLPDHLVRNGVKIGKFYQDDFLTFESDQVYDVVCSFGFLEHFSNFEEVIGKHIRLVKPGGILILSCPNFRGLQYVFHRLLDPVTLQRHVLPAMNLRRWRRVLEQNRMIVKYQGYYRTAGFWTDSPPSSFWVPPARRLITWVTGQIDRRINWPNSLLSPHMISFSEKRDMS